MAVPAALPIEVSAIRFVLENSSPVPRCDQCTLRLGSVGELEESIGNPRPALFFVRLKDIDLFKTAALGASVENLAKKDKTQGLGRYFGEIPPKQIGVIQAEYEALARLRRGASAALGWAPPGTTLIVGIDDGLNNSLVAEVRGQRSQPETDEGELLRALEAARLPIDSKLKVAFPGVSPAVRLVRQLVARAASHDLPVLLRGDPGTGKLTLAREIHRLAHGSTDRLFSVLDCTAYTTVAALENDVSRGLSSKTKGTLYIAHIEDMPPATQARLRVALRKRMARRPAKSIGGGMRLIAGAARDLYAQVLRGRFDDDLFFGLRVFPIDIPPVRERQHDVQALAAVFWERLRGSRAKLSPPLLQALEQYRWPGNGRELKAVLSRLYHLFGDRPHAQQMALLLKETGTSAGADSGLPLQCLQHLARVAEAVRAVSLSFVPLLARKAPPLAELRALKPRIEPHKQELAALMRYPLLFHDESVFTMLSDLEQRLVRLDELLGAPVPERAPTMWQSAGEPFTQRLQRALAREADLVRREMG